MRTSFSGLEIAYRALQSQQVAIDVTNHNIANASTDGYSRQRANFVSTHPIGVGAMSADGRLAQMGTGTTVTNITRVRNTFFDYQIRSESQTLSRWRSMRDTLAQVEVVFNEPSDTGINTALSKFWEAWQDVANAPEDVGVRGALVEQTGSLAATFNNVDTQLKNIRQDLDTQIRLRCDTINSISQQIADLNVQIAAVEVSGQPANDMRDRRDILLDQLANMAKVSYTEGSNGSLTVFMGNRTLVSANTAHRITYTVDTNNIATLTWQEDGNPVAIADSELKGLLVSRDELLPKYIDAVDALAAQLIARVNAQHRLGFGTDNSTNLDFFTGTGASDIAINPALKANPGKVAVAGAADNPGDASNATAILALQHALTMENGTTDFGGYFAAIMSRLGVDSERAQTMTGNEQLLVDHLVSQKEQTSGVSLDEETTHLLEYQRAYEAAARVITTVDEMLDKLINGTGVVGR